MAAGAETILKGQFLEFCDCYTICPCWVKDTPDEEHCSALYVWHFDPGCKIGGVDIGGKSVAMAAFHARRRGTQSAIFVDKTAAEEGKRLLRQAFSSAVSNPAQPALDPALTTAMAGLKVLLGDVVQTAEASIVLAAPAPGNPADQKHLQVTVSFEDDQGSCTTLAKAQYSDAIMQGQSTTLTLDHSALHDELKLQGAVDVQRVERFEFDVASLPAAPFVLKARSGMRARFDYTPPSA